MEQEFLVDVPTEENETAPVDAVVNPPEEPEIPDMGKESKEGDNPEGEGEQEETEPEYTDEEIAQNTEAAVSEAESVADFLSQHGINYDEMIQEYSQNGQLSERAYRELEEKAGLPRVMVDSYCAGQQARYELWANHVKSMVGGEENYAELMSFANETYSDSEKDAFDRAINSGDPQAARMVLDALVYRYQEANPEYDDGYEFEGQATNEPDVDGYSSPEEMYEVMEDPRMDTDPMFRAVHEARLFRTPWLHTNS